MATATARTASITAKNVAKNLKKNLSENLLSSAQKRYLCIYSTNV